jgi:PAS domain-containing protein
MDTAPPHPAAAHPTATDEHELDDDLPERVVGRPDLQLLLAEVVERLGPVAVMTALRDADDTIVDFRYEYVNPAFCETVGETPDTLEGQRLLELYPSHRDLGLFDAYCDVVDTGEPYVAELPWFDERNIKAHLEVRVVPFRDGYLLTGRDVTMDRLGEQVQEVFDTSDDPAVAEDVAELDADPST